MPAEPREEFGWSLAGLSAVTDCQAVDDDEVDVQFYKTGKTGTTPTRWRPAHPAQQTPP